MDRQKNALIIDQSPIFRSTLKDVIQTNEPHVRVSEARDAEQALDILQDQSPEVVFLDIALSRGNGIEFIGRIKHMLPETRIVVLTSHDSAEQKAASLQQGADIFLSKERAVGLYIIDIINETLGRHGTT